MRRDVAIVVFWMLWVLFVFNAGLLLGAATGTFYGWTP